MTQRVCPGQTVTFVWSAEGRLSSVTVNGQTTALEYNAAGRLVRQTTGTIVRHFLWEGDNPLAELDGAGTGKVAEYSYYPGLDNPHALIVGTTKYFAHGDGVGNVIALTDEAKAVKRTYEYDAWGQPAGGMDFGGFAGADRARFKGALWLGAELDIYYMRARWYEPKSGRFLSEDPLGLAGGIYLYSFAGNDPINGRDPTGTCEEDEELWVMYHDNDGDRQLSDGDTIVASWCEKVGGGGGGTRGGGRSGQEQQEHQQCPTGLLVWPVGGRGEVTSRFQVSRMHPMLGYARPHRGIDVAVPLGTPSVSASYGHVETAGWNDGGFGNLVEVIDIFDGFLYRYGHLSSVSVTRGTFVTPGQVLGSVGQTGLATGPNLHFEIRTPQGTPIDPLGCLP